MSAEGEIEIQQTSEGCQLRVHVRPGAKRSGIEGVHGGALKMSVKEVPEQGRATRAAIRLLGTALGVSAPSISLVAGAKSREKLLRVAGLSPPECRRRLSAVLGEGG